MTKALIILFVVLSLALLMIGCSSDSAIVTSDNGSAHPSLILTQSGVKMIRSGESAPLFDQTLDQSRDQIDAAISNGIDVPIPKDMAGGYTHEKHKSNYREMHLAGALYQITQDEKYAAFIKEMLMKYADMFPTLPIHPTDRSYSTGKLFWQCLNDANWLVYTSQAYDCIYDYLTEDERRHLEDDLFRPYADFISVENPQFFNRVHNHSTWGNAAVGMMGIAMNDTTLINRALYGLPLDNKNNLAKDNDGGFIYEDGKAKAGFFAQMDFAFSPDGFYTEGPYYQRYAMTPFMLFAQAIANNLPEKKIFEYRDGLLLKAVYALLYQTNGAGEFFPINDAQKGMSFKASSVITAVNIAYGIESDPQLMDVAQQQGSVLLDQNGYQLARGLATGTTQPFVKKSIALSDGAAGDEGALGILRSGIGDEEITVAFKYTGQGLGHGHYDKLGYLIYAGASEVLQDYGAARWVNVDQKGGGRYLPENKTWAKQTIAHNALVVDGQSHFGGKYEIANTMHSDPYFFDASNPKLQIASAKEKNAYPGVDMHRTIRLWKYADDKKPLVIDVVAAFSDQVHQYDLPIQYGEELMQTNFEYNLAAPYGPLGKGHGYQHVYKEASGNLDDSGIQFTWFKDGRFNSMTSISSTGDQAILARAGANDPSYNIRKDGLLIHRKLQQKDALFISVIESHGDYSPVTELPSDLYPNVKSVKRIKHDSAYTIFSITLKDDYTATFCIANDNTDPKAEHNISVGNQSYQWTGTHTIID